MLIAVVALYALSYHGSCATNEAKAETKALATDPPGKTLRVDLIRQDSLNLSNADRLRRAIERSHNRQRRLQHSTSPKNESFYSPITAGDGEFLMQMAIGSPVPLNLHFILDTGSDLIWTQCQPCGDSCIVQNDPIYNPFQSSSFTNISCSDKFCLVLNSTSQEFCDLREHCIYGYLYGDFSYTIGVLAYETFSLATAGSPTQTSFLNLAFGCGRQQGGFLTAPFSYSAGIIGLGRGPLSLVSQIGSSIDNIFSYCLGSIYNASQISPLFLGRAATSGAGFTATPLIQNNISYYTTFYYLSLRGISVAGKAVPIPKGTFDILSDGSGGLIIDSGTTLTFLVDPAYTPFLAAVKSTIEAHPANSSASSLDLCYNATSDLKLPTITFHFAGGANYVLPPENSFVSNQDYTGELLCLAFGSSGPLGSKSIFGNVQQQNVHIVYDLGHNELYFARTNCAKS
jgi:hypothetical protein